MTYCYDISEFFFHFVRILHSCCNTALLFSFSIEIYKHNKEERIARTWGTTAPGLPYVEEAITNAGDWLIGGDLEVIEPIKYNDGLDQYRLSPAQLREEFTRRNADAVFAFSFATLYTTGMLCLWLTLANASLIWATKTLFFCSIHWGDSQKQMMYLLAGEWSSMRRYSAMIILSFPLSQLIGTKWYLFW